MVGIEKLVEGIHDKRVLVIDDNEFVAQHLAERLGNYYSQVDSLSDSTQAFGTIVDAISANNPYNALSLDLDMPEVNGIKLLKLLRSHGITIPTVLYSAEQGNPLAIKAFHQMSVVTNLEELESVIGDVDKAAKGIPITYLRKFEDKNPIQLLVNAIDAMLLVNQRKDADLSQFLAGFSQSEEEYHYDNNHFAQMADLVKLTKQRFIELREALAPYEPFLKKSEDEGLFKEIDKHIEMLSDENFSVNGLSDPEYGRGNIHLLQTYYRPQYIEALYGSYLQNPVESLKARYKGKGRIDELESITTKFKDSHALLSRAFEYHQAMSRQFNVIYPIEINDQLDRLLEQVLLLRGRGDITLEENYINQGLEVETEPELISHLLVNPLSNAIDAVEGNDEKRIYLETRRTYVSRLPKKEKEYFTQLEYKENQPIVRVLIKDNGCGIPPENLEKISREGFTTKGSTGYGLSFLDQRIGKVPGTYRIQSKVGEGTDFYMYFPVFKEKPVA